MISASRGDPHDEPPPVAPEPDRMRGHPHQHEQPPSDHPDESADFHPGDGEATLPTAAPPALCLRPDHGVPWAGGRTRGSPGGRSGGRRGRLCYAPPAGAVSERPPGGLQPSLPDDPMPIPTLGTLLGPFTLRGSPVRAAAAHATMNN